MDVGELGDGVTDVLVDVAGNLAAHGVGERNVHVGGGQRRRHRLEAIADREHDVGLECLEDRRQLDQPSPVDFAIVAGVSPSTSMNSRASTAKPSRSMISTTAP